MIKTLYVHSAVMNIYVESKNSTNISYPFVRSSQTELNLY